MNLFTAPKVKAAPPGGHLMPRFEPRASIIETPPGMAPAIAAEESLPTDNPSDAGKLATEAGVSPDVAKQATEPSDGSADKSGGAMERSSAPRHLARRQSTRML